MAETIQICLWGFSKSCSSQFTSDVFPLVSCEDREESMGAEIGPARTVVVFCPQSELIQEAMEPMFFKF